MTQEVSNSEEGAIKEILAWQPKLYQKMVSIEEHLIRKERTKLGFERHDFLVEWVKKKGYVCYSEGSKDPRFNELFPSTQQFHRVAVEVSNAYHFKINLIGKNKIYHLPDFPLEQIAKLPKTMANYQNPDFIKQLAKIVWDAERLNVDEWLSEHYPHLNNDEKANILDELEKVQKHRVPIKRESQRVWFSRREVL